MTTQANTASEKGSAQPAPSPREVTVTVTVTIPADVVATAEAMYGPGFTTAEDLVNLWIDNGLDNHLDCMRDDGLVPEGPAPSFEDSPWEPGSPCPICAQPTRYVATMGTPGVGQVWECQAGHSLVKSGEQLQAASWLSTLESER